MPPTWKEQAVSVEVRCQFVDKRIRLFLDSIEKDFKKAETLCMEKLSAQQSKLAQFKLEYSELIEQGLLAINSSSAIPNKEEELSDFLEGNGKVLELMDEMEVRIDSKLRVINLSRDNQQVVMTKIPKVSYMEFDTSNPELWFIGLELQFQAAGIVGEKAKFLSMQRLLSQAEAQIIASITLKAETLASPYTEARALLIKAFELHKFQRIEAAFDLTLDVETEKPSQFLGKIKFLTEGLEWDDLHQWLVWRRMSPDMRMTLMGYRDISNADNLAQRADLLVNSSHCKVAQGTEVMVHQIEGVNKTLCSEHKKFGSGAKVCFGTPRKRCPMWRPSLRPRKRFAATVESGNEEDDQ